LGEGRSRLLEAVVVIVMGLVWDIGWREVCWSADQSQSPIQSPSRSLDQNAGWELGWSADLSQD
jgi:hypothetical protein